MARPPIHPGEILAEELAEIGMSGSALARDLRVPQNRISQIMAGKRAITGDTALRLAHWFKTSGAFWLALQSSYDLRMAELAHGSEIRKLPVMSERPAATKEGAV